MASQVSIDELAFSEENGFEASSIKELLQHLRAQRTDEFTQLRIIGWMSNLEPEDVHNISGEHVNKRNILADNGCLNEILSAMERFPNNRQLQHAACICIRNIGRNPLLINMNNAYETMEELVVVAIDAHGMNCDFAQSAFGAIENICSVGRRRAKFENIDVGKRIINIMDTFPVNESVQTKGFAALRKLRIEADTLMRLDIGTLSLRAMRNFPRNMDLQSEGCYIIAKATKSNFKHAYSLLNLGAKDAVMKALRAARRSSTVVDVNIMTYARQILFKALEQEEERAFWSESYS